VPAHAPVPAPLSRRLLGATLAALAACAPAQPPPAAPPGPAGSTFAGQAGPLAPTALEYDALVAAPEAPMSLTASDGTGLALARLEARVVIEGPLAFTELHLRFDNPEDRVREGRFAIALPPGAAISRFAMAIDGRWMEAEMVERQAARRAYEDFLHRKQDPALLEKQAGNEFQARVFPIPARASKDLIVAYSQELASARAPYVLPLRGLPVVGEVEATARVMRPGGPAPGWDDVVLRQRGWKPDRDFAVDISDQAAAVQSGDLVAIRVAPELGAATDAPAALTILVDTSASRALGFDRQIAAVGELVAQLRAAHGDLGLRVAAFDQDVLPIFDGPASGFGAAQIEALRARQPLGASDLGAALAWVKSAGGRGRVVVMTDAVVTAGDGELAALEAAVKALAPAVERLDVVVSGGIRDEAIARGLTRGLLGHDGAVLDLDRTSAGEIARRLGLATRSGLAVAVDGARWVWPERVDGVQPGDELVVYASLGRATGKPVTVRIGDQVQRVAPVSVARPLLERAAAGIEIARLEADLGRATDPGRRRALAQSIVAVSTRRRVLSDLTALLVLETENDYARFGLDRRGLADILVVGPRGLDVVQRTGQPALPIAVDAIATDGRATDDKAKKQDSRGGRIVDAGVEGGAVAGNAGGPAGAPTEAPRAEPRVVLGGTVRPAAPSAAAPASDDELTDKELAALAEAEASEDAELIVVTGSAAGRGVAGGVLHNLPESSSVAAEEGSRDAARRRAPARRGVERDPRDYAPSPAPMPVIRDDSDTFASPPAQGRPAPLEGPLADVMALIAARRLDEALVAASRWRKEQPGDVLALVALGEALEARGQRVHAARAYGSIIDLFPGRADLRRFAGERLERVADAGRAIAIDTYRRAVADRPDHLTGHRLLASALIRAGKLEDAFAALEAGLAQPYPGGRFEGGVRILREDLGLVAAAWTAREPGKRAAIEQRLAAAGGIPARGPSLRFVLSWETDANDVDFHIYDRHGDHAFYSNRQLRSGGELYADVTDGFGPECFTVPGTGKAGPYRLQIHYYSKGPMGYGMGLLEILRHDGKGGLSFEHRPFIAMTDGAFVDLGTVSHPAATIAN
jgi:hypothetical protein